MLGGMDKVAGEVKQEYHKLGMASTVTGRPDQQGSNDRCGI